MGSTKITAEPGVPFIDFTREFDAPRAPQVIRVEFVRPRGTGELAITLEPTPLGPAGVCGGSDRGEGGQHEEYG